MQKILAILGVAVLALGLNGCNGSSDGSLTTLFLVDDQGFSYAGIPYRCDSMRTWERTASNGEFSFYLNESCRFDFLGLNGNLNNSVFDEIIRIVDYRDNGKGGIAYDCLSFSGSTYYGDEFFSPYRDGSFEYDADDQCTFYL
jgi:hypothetical protein